MTLLKTTKSDIYFFVIVATSALLFGISIHFEILGYDDATYINHLNSISNLDFRSTIVNIFTSNVNANWHPITILSLYIDYMMFGLFGGGYHLTNTILHILNIWILFNLLKLFRLPLLVVTITTLLFAMHPINAEAVMWISERKGILASFFALITFYLHVRSIQEHKLYLKHIAIVIFCLSLASKATIVMLPVFFILLDLYDFNSERAFRFGLKKFTNSLCQNLPYLLASLIFGLVTFFVQSSANALPDLNELSVISRINNFTTAIPVYFYNLFFNFDYSIFYPFKETYSGIELAIGYIVVGSLFSATIYYAKKLPLISICLGWFFIILLPVSGLIQTGGHAYADRYMYLPAIGIFLLSAYAIVGLIKKLPYKMLMQRYEILLPIMFIVLLITPLSKNILNWKNTITIFNHSIESVGDNILAHSNLAVYYAYLNMPDESHYHYKKCRETYTIRPNYIQFILKAISRHYLARKQYAIARSYIQEGIDFNPKSNNFYILMAASYLSEHRYNEAKEYIERGLEISPNDLVLNYLLGITYEYDGNYELAAQRFKASSGVTLHPNRNKYFPP